MGDNMAVNVAFRGTRPDRLGPQLADAVSSATPIVIDKPGMYAIWTTAAHTIYIRHKNDAGANATGGEAWANGEKQLVYLEEGTKIHYS